MKDNKSEGNKSDDNKSDDIKRRVILLVVKIALFLSIIFIVFFVVFGATRMRDHSMYTAVRDGDLLFYYRLENNFHNGDVVVVDVNGEEKVMRIIASPGQSLDIIEDELFIDGQPSTFTAFYKTTRAEKTTFVYPYQVSQNCYFMMNDYRSNTNDSRAFGEVCRDKIKGRLITKIQIRDL